jgi:hypothetical protein
MIGFYVNCVGILGISTFEIRPVSYSDIPPNKQAAYYKHAVKEYWSRSLPKVFDLIPRCAASPCLGGGGLHNLHFSSSENVAASPSC